MFFLCLALLISLNKYYCTETVQGLEDPRESYTYLPYVGTSVFTKFEMFRPGQTEHQYHIRDDVPTFLVWDLMTPPPRCRKCVNSGKSKILTNFLKRRVL